MKTSELEGAALNWAVAKCEGRRIGFTPGGGLEVRGRTEDGAELPEAWDLWMPWYPSANWAQGGPIIEREKIDVVFRPGDKLPGFWDAYGAGTPHGFSAPTPLSAAMRCYVASKLGDTVDIPEELK